MEEKPVEKVEEIQVEQAHFLKAFRNYFHNDDAIRRLIKIGKLYLEVNIARPQAVRLLNEFWGDKKIRNKQHFNEIADDEIVRWLVSFVKEHKGNV